MTETHAGARLGRYRLVQRIGEGGMGVVHLALDGAGRAVAVKVMRPHIAGDPDARRRLVREVETLRRVRHPRVAAVLDADVDGDTPYVVTQYVPAPALDRFVCDAGPLPAPALARLGDGLGQALATIHAAGVVHRDPKPANVLMLDGDPVVIDFGIAHVADDVRLTSTGLVMGTPGYLSPEVLAGDPVGPATDWWGWAATMAFAATGRPPFGRGPAEAVMERVRRGEADLDGVPAGLLHVLRRGLDVEPARRPAPGELRQAVESLRGRGPAAAAAATQPLRQVPPTRAVPVVPGPAPLAERAVAPPPAPVHPATTRRTGTLAAGLLALAALAAVAPVMAALLGLAGTALARTVDRSQGALLRRRYERGPRRSDVAWTVLASPAQLLRAALVSLPAAVLPLLVGVAAAFVTSWVLGRPAATAGAVSPGGPVPLAVGAAAAALTGWWGPGGTSVRRGTRATLRGIAPGRRGGQVAVAVLLVVAGAAALTVLGGTQPDWTPLQGPPLAGP
ncbi:MAG: serine/threonine-protein kinase [Actinomycetes bacterium]